MCNISVLFDILNQIKSNQIKLNQIKSNPVESVSGKYLSDTHLD